jgi:hypothetical protein
MLQARIGVYSSHLSATDLAQAHLLGVPDIAADVADELAAAGPQPRVRVLPAGPQPIPFLASAEVSG